MNKLSVFLLVIVAMFGVIPCVCAQDDDPCARFADVNVQIICRTMLFGGKGQEGLIAFRNEFIKKYSVTDEELPTSFSSPSTSTDRSQIMKYAFPSAPSVSSETDNQAAPSAGSEKNDQGMKQTQPQESNTDKGYNRRNIFQ